MVTEVLKHIVVFECDLSNLCVLNYFNNLKITFDICNFYNYWNAYKVSFRFDSNFSFWN